MVRRFNMLGFSSPDRPGADMYGSKGMDVPSMATHSARRSARGRGLLESASM
jgi:hypothetical protein